MTSNRIKVKPGLAMATLATTLSDGLDRAPQLGAEALTNARLFDEVSYLPLTPVSLEVNFESIERSRWHSIIRMMEGNNGKKDLGSEV